MVSGLNPIHDNILSKLRFVHCVTLFSVDVYSIFRTVYPPKLLTADLFGIVNSYQGYRVHNVLRILTLKAQYTPSQSCMIQ